MDAVWDIVWTDFPVEKMMFIRPLGSEWEVAMSGVGHRKVADVDTVLGLAQVHGACPATRHRPERWNRELPETLPGPRRASSVSSNGNWMPSAKSLRCSIRLREPICEKEKLGPTKCAAGHVPGL